ncbi:hypothetical protein KEJ39_06385, partial [Candidatus Bathyarchaeota archaeon]|nr:hypothetical protein [Candidatus Bathyarchaeota archaeon]
QVAGDILPRVRCQFSKSIYSYGEPVVFHLDIEVFPNTMLGEFCLEEIRPDGTTRIVFLGMLDQGNYDFEIGEAAPPPGYRPCTLITRRLDPNGFADIVRWKGGYAVAAATEPVPTPAPSLPPPTVAVTIEPETGRTISDQEGGVKWLPSVFIILAIAAVLLVLHRSLDIDRK